MGNAQCYICGEHVEYLVDDGVCQSCFEKRNDEKE